MTTSNTAPTYNLIRAAEAITNWRALAMTALAALALFISFSLTGVVAKSSLALAGLFTIVTFIVWLVGYSSVGIVVMRQAQGQQIGFVDAILQAIFTFHRLIGIVLALLVILILAAIVALLILFVCKIPGVGPLLFAVVFPVLAVIFGVIWIGLFYIAFPLSAPSIWAGNTVGETIARIFEIVRKRLVSVITSLILLTFLVILISGVISGILLSGYVTTLGLSQGVGISVFGGITDSVIAMVSGGMGGYQGYGGNGQSMAYTGPFAFATGLLFMIGAIIPFLTFINGTCLVYLQATEGLNFGEAEELLRSHVEEAKRRAQDAKDRANSKLHEVRESSQSAKPSYSVAPATRVCVSCKATLNADDIFCGECGAKNPL